MTLSKVESFNVIGISVRTTNADGQAAQDIQALWGRFMQENLHAQIPSKDSEDIYCIYTDYEGDHSKPYSTILGAKVKDLNTIPNGMVGMSFTGGQYQKYSCKGAMSEGVVYQAWNKIWNDNLDRAYTADVEIYSAKSQDPENLEVDILVALNN